MLTTDDIKARLKQKPFVPVRFVTSSGQVFDVFHPDLIMVGRQFMIIGTASADDPTTLSGDAGLTHARHGT